MFATALILSAVMTGTALRASIATRLALSYVNSWSDDTSDRRCEYIRSSGILVFPVYDHILAPSSHPSDTEVSAVFELLRGVREDCSRYLPAARRLLRTPVSDAARNMIFLFLSSHGNKTDVKLAFAFLNSDRGIVTYECLNIIGRCGGPEDSQLVESVLISQAEKWEPELRNHARTVLIQMNKRFAAEAAKPKPVPPAPPAKAP